MTVFYTYAESPVGLLLLTSDGTALTGLYLEESQHRPQIGGDWAREDEAAPFAEARQQMAAYFAGARREFDLPLAPAGTEFQKQVWAALTLIPYGTTATYGEIARQIGAPKASRAVGHANGRNPLFIVVPCHRVVGASGRLIGYGGGLSRKEALLTLERGL